MSDLEQFADACENLFHAFADPFLEEVEKFVDKVARILGWEDLND